jgi:hypothetical protein
MRKRALVLGWAACCTLIANVPYIYGHLVAPPGRVFMGDARAFIDTNSYLAWMHQAADGHVLFKDVYTTEPHARMLFHPLFFALGNVARGLGLTVATVHSAARVAFGFAVFVALYPFACLFFRRESSRWMAVVVTSLSMGFSWLVHVPGVSAVPESWFLTGWVEASTFMAVYALPLFSASLLLMLGTFHLLLRAFAERRSRLAAWAGALGLLLFSTHFFDTLIVYPVLAAYVIVQFLLDEDEEAFRFRLRASALFVAVSVISPLWNLFSSLVNPVFREHAWEAAVTTTPSFLWVLACFGLLAPLAAIGVAVVAGDRKHPLAPQRNFLVVWMLALPFLLYLPIPFQRRLVEGGQVPVAMLAACGLCWIADRWRLRPLVVGALYVCLSLPAVGIFLADDMTTLAADARMQSVAGFLDSSMLDAMEWMERNEPRDEIVLADFEIGNYIPAVSGNVVYIGHSPETLDFWGKWALVRHFFDASTGDAWRREFVARTGISLIFYSWKEKRLGGFDPAGASWLAPVYRNGEVTLYRVRPR